jgi:hypothetical protein
VHAASVDWNEVTALATGALALLTFLLVIAAIIAAVLAKRDIDTQLETSAEDLKATREATQAAQTMAQRQIETSYRPLLIDVPPDGPVPYDPLEMKITPMGEGPRIHVEFPGGHAADFDPRQIYVGLSGGRMNIAVPLRNVGNGVAAILPALITVGGQRIGEMVGCIIQSTKLVPPGETTRIVCVPRLTQSEMADYPWTVIVQVPYQDYVGRQPTVARVWLEQRHKETEWLLHGVDQVIGDEARAHIDRVASASWSGGSTGASR